MLRPKVLDTLKGYSFSIFAKDCVAGVIVGIVALPLAIAFAIASGVTPERGLYTAIIAGFLVALLGGSRVQVAGPTGAFIVIVYGIVQKFGYEGLVVATIMAGIILIVMGVARFGSIIKFIPHSVTIGFTAGIALIIFAGQWSDLLGLGLKNPPGFIDKIQLIAMHLSTVNWTALAIGLLTILAVIYVPKIVPWAPGSLVAIIVSAVVVLVWKLPVETIGTRFGAISPYFPLPRFPAIDLATIQLLIKPAFTIAMLGSIESLLSAVVADGMIGGKHRSNTELVAQGIANIVSPIFGGIPATGAIARTATNIKSGGKTPVAAMVHALTLLLILVFFGRWAGYIPMACLSGILCVVAYNMSEWRSARAIIKASSSSGLVFLATFLITVFFDLSLAIEIGIFMSAISFIRAMTEYTHIDQIDDDDLVQYSTLSEKQRASLPKDVRVYEIHGPLFFGAAYKFKEAMAELNEAPRAVIINMKHVPTIDSSGLHLLEDIQKLFSKGKTQLILSHPKQAVLTAMQRFGIAQHIGHANIVPNFSAAIKRAEEIVR